MTFKVYIKKDQSNNVFLHLLGHLMSESHGSVSLLLPEHGCPPNSGVGLVQLRVLVLFLTVIPPSQDTVQELQGLQGAQLPSTKMKIDGKVKT